jgi:hypothetical protein
MSTEPAAARPAGHVVIRDPRWVVAAARVGVAARELAYPSLIVPHPYLLSSRIDLPRLTLSAQGLADNIGVRECALA